MSSECLFYKLVDYGYVFDLAFLDDFINKSIKLNNKRIIKIAECPICSKSIKSSMRYGNIFKRFMSLKYRNYEENSKEGGKKRKTILK